MTNQPRGPIDWARHQQAEREARQTAAPAATEATDAAESPLHKLITTALHDARKNGLGGMTEKQAVNHMANAVLAAILGPIPDGITTADWTAIRALQLMNEASQQRDKAQAALEQVRTRLGEQS
ncbi:hypothetical protein ACIF8T_21775 [Streptomyces sp. NPDC085946]|uniref:hypothetical protein n=1 Tax=Streptomyces sp. NPDC085946 TaxID=3365744 RepID=UPI0037D41F6B